MVCNLNAKQFFNRFQNFLQPWITKLKHPAITDIHEVVVLFELETAFELSTVVSKLMFGYQITVEQQFNCVVQSCAAHPVFVVFHPDVEGFDVEMALGGIDLL